MTNIPQEYKLTDEDEKELEGEIIEVLTMNYILRPKGMTEKDCMVHDLLVVFNDAVAKAMPLIEKRAREKIFADLEYMALIKNHTGHKKGEVELVSCARCSYEEYKGQSLRESK